MITYIEKGAGLHRAIHAAGHRLEQQDGIWVSSNDVVVQAIIDGHDELADRKVAKITELKAEALRRVQLVFPAIENFDELALVREQYLSVAPAARTPTANFQRVIDIYQAALAARSTINGYTTVGAASGYDIVNTPAWPV